MSGKPIGVLLLAVLQLIEALLFLVAGYLIISVIADPISALLLALPAMIFIIIGIIGLILFYGLYTTKGWAWLWTLIMNLLGILGGVMAFGSLLTNLAQLGGFVLSIIIVIYLLMPSTRAAFKK
jgi:hypothetical protein